MKPRLVRSRKKPLRAASGQAVPEPAAPEAAPKDQAANDDGPQMSLRDHLSELRTRILRCAVSVFICFIGVFYFAPVIRGIMETTLKAALPPGGEITFVDITEPLIVDMQIALIVGLFVAAPYIFYQIWAFIAPGLYESERKYVVPVAFCSALFFIGGGAFCYLVVIPFTYSFFIGYGSGAAKPLITLANTFRFTLRLLLAFGIMFEMPLFSFFLARLGVITAARLRAWRRYAVLACFIIAALITPPEVYSQLLLAGPLILLYEISIMVAAAAAPSKRKTTASDPSQV
ncbi:twin-arginine translocase subunit TatC [Desulfovibrio sp. OttesenSCG-928-O18]|nr:twin-arginine translocase subunit TatC [Desulfovibrio sp. OttesenSCG-928-O18]